ncbi:cytidine deaminase [Frigoriflavimonas asaccharolytica]|uniref:Cytidine deaminase n=1 Tax=Frigoriflavimonas asaccharolytica TaxID=2735899 RepID=A0A8J8G9D3_9FLAO|nr:cytidine deaminase [Frigoriflavimonas asaccharolytica]NRS93080.1 cytidine deaminase [Frigoriflavimonas asaccharolytica]
MTKNISIDYDYFENSNNLSEIEKTLFNLAKSSRLKAYAPYSKFLVGCAILLENGEIISGNNQENAAYPSGICAERTAIFYASANFPDVKILKLFVLGASLENLNKAVPTPPCGACRQVISEYENKQSSEIEIYFANMDDEICKVKSIRSLLPFTFDASFL